MAAGCVTSRTSRDTMMRFQVAAALQSTARLDWVSVQCHPRQWDRSLHGHFKRLNIFTSWIAHFLELNVLEAQHCSLNTTTIITTKYLHFESFKKNSPFIRTTRARRAHERPCGARGRVHRLIEGVAGEGVDGVARVGAGHLLGAGNVGASSIGAAEVVGEDGV